MRALIKGLPPEAALYRSTAELGGWTVTDHLLASVIDTLGVVSYNALVGPHADPKKLRQVKPAEAIPRPGKAQRQRTQRRRATADDLKTMFAGATAFAGKELNP